MWLSVVIAFKKYSYQLANCYADVEYSEMAQRNAAAQKLEMELAELKKEKVIKYLVICRYIYASLTAVT